MSKAFTTEQDPSDPEDDEPEALPSGVKNYMTPTGFATLQDELNRLDKKFTDAEDEVRANYNLHIDSTQTTR